MNDAVRDPADRGLDLEALLGLHEAIDAVKKDLDAAGIEMPAEIIALQATPSFRAAIQGNGDVTPGGSLASTPAHQG